MQRLSHRRVTRAAPVLNEGKCNTVSTAKLRATSSTFQRKGRDEPDLVCSRHNTVHLVEELALARWLRAQVQTDIGSLHRRPRRRVGAVTQPSLLPTSAEPP